MLVYVAGPLTVGNKTQNVRRAINAGEKIASKGHSVFIPHLFELWELIYHHDYEFWMKLDIVILKKCDILVRLPGYSKGSDRELGLAKQFGLLTFGDVHINGLIEFMNSKYWCQTDQH